MPSMTTTDSRHYRHCEYQSLDFTHVVPEAQVVQPVQPFPPHWAQWAAVQPPGVVVLAGGGEVLVVVGLADVVDVTSVVLVELVLVLVAGLELELLELPPPLPPEPVVVVSNGKLRNKTYDYSLPGPDTDVVILPLSM